MSVTFWTLQLSSGSRRRLVFFVHDDTSETIGTRCHPPPFSVTMQQRPKTPKHNGNPGRSGLHSTLFKGLITVRLQIALRDRWGSKTKRQRDGDSSSSFVASLPELKDGFLEQCLHGFIAWLKLLPSIEHMGLIYPCVSQWWCRKHQAPPGRNERGGRKGEMLVVEKCQCHKGGSRWHIAGSSFVLWCASSK